MELSALTAVSPIDGRYCDRTRPLAAYFSEYALFKYRVLVEVEYLIALSLIPLPQLSGMGPDHHAALRGLVAAFTVEEAQRIKDIEKVTNHDIKAVEYYLKEKLALVQPPMAAGWLEFVHFGLTSQDINNTASPLALREAVQQSFLPSIRKILEKLTALAEGWREVPMLARTHGQPATPTNLGKEVRVWIERLQGQLKHLEAVPFSAKFGGATGNLNAHHVAFPTIDWRAFADKFVNEQLGLVRTRYTTQIEPYDNLAALCDAVKRTNTILLDLCRDFWTYISMDYFKQQITAGEVGSSAMPHKVNPIDFENAEGNLGLSTAVLEHLAVKLPVSRLQRDLTDSTVLRALGVPFAHCLIAHNSILRGLGKLQLNAAAIEADLNANWAICAEAIQTVLRREGYPKPYEALRDLTRTGRPVTQPMLHEFIDTSLACSPEVKAELKRITPSNYTGLYWDDA